MDWLRRNWPDLLIGVALVAVIAGIIATLVSGGSFFPVGNRNTETPRTSPGITAGQTPGQDQNQPGIDQPSQATPEQPGLAGAQPGSSLTSSADGADGVDDQEPPAVAVDPLASDGANEPAAGQPDQSSSAQQPSDEPARSSSVEALPPDASADVPASPASPSSSSVSSSASQSSSSSQASSQPPAASGPPASASADDEAPYRVSVGAFGSLENARRQQETFEAAGYPVFIGTQGDLNIVLVGPYDTEAEARSVAARIAGSEMGVSDPTVYRFEPDEETASASTPGSTPASGQPASSPAAGQSTEPAQAQADAPASSQSAAQASASGRYLQVGAYGSRDSSLPQRERLEEMGFVVSDRVENDLVKLLVGPFDAGQLADAQARLQSAGIESFPR